MPFLVVSFQPEPFFSSKNRMDFIFEELSSTAKNGYDAIPFFANFIDATDYLEDQQDEQDELDALILQVESQLSNLFRLLTQPQPSPRSFFEEVEAINYFDRSSNAVLPQSWSRESESSDLDEFFDSLFNRGSSLRQGPAVESERLPASSFFNRSPAPAIGAVADIPEKFENYTFPDYSDADPNNFTLEDPITLAEIRNPVCVALNGVVRVYEHKDFLKMVTDGEFKNPYGREKVRLDSDAIFSIDADTLKDHMQAQLLSIGLSKNTGPGL